MVVGGGKIAEDKVVQLLEAGAACVLLISRALHGALVRLFTQGRIRWPARAFQPGDIAGDPPLLAIALSQFEAGFVSLAHSDADLKQAWEAFEAALPLQDRQVAQTVQRW